MSLFSDDAVAIAADVLGEDAQHQPGGGPAAAIRVIPRTPDAVTAFGDGRFVSDATMFLVPVAQASAIARGDAIVWNGVTYEVTAAPTRDDRRLWWRVEARAN